MDRRYVDRQSMLNHCFIQTKAQSIFKHFMCVFALHSYGSMFKFVIMLYKTEKALGQKLSATFT